MSRFTLFVVTLLLASCGSNQSATSSVYLITNDDQLIGGPQALGTIGDYMLENDKIRVVIHGPEVNRASLFNGGGIIDADLQRPSGEGADELTELAPIFFLEGFRPEKFSIENSGSNGEAAVLVVEGVGDDFFQAAHLVNQAMLFEAGLKFKIRYILEPGSSVVEIRTTVTNDTNTVHPFPFLEPSQFAGAGLDIPGIENVEVSVPMGSLIQFNGAMDKFVAGVPGLDIENAIRDAYEISTGLPAFPGIVTEYIAASGKKVSYAYYAPATDDNYVNQFADSYAGQEIKPSSIVVPFIIAGLMGTFHHHPPPVMLANQNFSYSTFFSVGAGDIASAAKPYFDSTGQEIEKLTGRLLDSRSLAGIEDVRIVVREEATKRFVTAARTNGAGDWACTVPRGDYEIVVADDVYDRASQIVSVTAATFVEQQVAPPAEVAVNVVDENGVAVPAKVTIVGRHDPADNNKDPRDFLFDLSLGDSQRSTDFEPTKSGYVEGLVYTDAYGTASIKVRPGTYDVVASRGPEYELSTEEIEIGTGQTKQVGLALKRAFETPGYISTDLHLHALNSPDSGTSLTTHVRSLVGEGLEHVASTDHNAIADYRPEIVAEGLDDWLHTSIGVEVTSFEMGHFNGYPLAYDASSPRGGDIIWQGRTPQSIFDQIRERGAIDPENTIVQVNHVRDSILGYFSDFNFSQDTGNPEAASGFTAVFQPYTNEFGVENFSWDFDTIELYTGKYQHNVRNYRVPDPLPPLPHPTGITLTPGEVLLDADGKVAFPGVVDDWFAMLNRGIFKVGVGTSDSHGHTAPGFARTYVNVGEKDDPAILTDQVVVDGLKSGDVSISQGLFLKASMGDSSMGQLHSGTSVLAIELRAPQWAPAEKITVWANGGIVEEISLSSEEQTSYDGTVTLSLTVDSWVVVEATSSANMFPILTPQEEEIDLAAPIINALSVGFDFEDLLNPWGNVRPQTKFIMNPYALTNPIFVDVDGNGKFDAPLPTPTSLKNAPPDIFKEFEGYR